MPENENLNEPAGADPFDATVRRVRLTVVNRGSNFECFGSYENDHMMHFAFGDSPHDALANWMIKHAKKIGINLDFPE